MAGGRNFAPLGFIVGEISIQDVRFHVFEVISHGEGHVAHQQQKDHYAQTPQVTPDKTAVFFTSQCCFVI